MKRQYLMSFDAGTGAGRCILTDTEGHLIATSYAEWAYTRPPEAPQNGQSFAPDEFWGILSGLSRQVIADGRIPPREIVAVSTTSQREGMVFIDSQGRELYAGPNVDLRGIAETGKIEKFADEIREVTGLGLHGIYGLCRLLWFKHHFPEVYERIYRVMMISDWIAFRLTGVPTTEPSVASSSQLLDLSERDWSSRIVELAGLRDDILPPVYPAGERIGYVTPQAAVETGLAPGTVVAAGGGDTHAGLLGMGLTKPNQIGAVAGTSTPLMFTLDHVLIDPEKRVSTNCHLISGCWTLESNAGMTGLPYRWVRDTFADVETGLAEGLGMDPYEYMNDQAEQVPPGAGGWLAFLGAGLAGKNRHSDLGGFIFPVSWTLDHFDRRHMFRAALETMAFGVCTNANQLAQIVGANLDSLHVCGGQSKSALFNQTLANILNLPVHLYQVKEATGLGAVICAAVGAGIYASLEEAAHSMVHLAQVVEPEPKHVGNYKEAYQDWLSLGQYLEAYPGLTPYNTI